MTALDAWSLLLAQAAARAPIQINLIKLLLIIPVYLLWVFTVAWADKECRDHRMLYLQREFWNTILFWSGIVGLFIILFVPDLPHEDPIVRWISWAVKYLLFWAAYLIPTWLFIATRNRYYPIDEAITPMTIFADTMALLGVRVKVKKKKAGFGPPIRFVTAAGQQAKMQEPETDDPEEATALIETWVATKELVYDAIKRRATDVFMEPRGQVAVVAYKIDGVLMPTEPMERELAESVLHTLKTMAGLDPQERRKPQSGTFKAVLKGQEIDLKLNTLGTRAGERMHLQIFHEQTHPESLEELGMREQAVQQLKEIVAQPAGIVLIGGPKESGKTTTAHALLYAVDRFMRNVVTLEDKFEYKLETVTRHRVDLEAGETPFTKLRSVVRTEPDVVMVDELHEPEQAKLIAQAAAERLFIVTLGAHDVPSTIARFREMVGDPELAAQSLLAVISPRLVRRLCDECKEAYQPNPQALQRLNLPVGRIRVFYRPPPPPERDEDICPKCMGVGYYGRTGVFEIVIVNDALRQVIATGGNVKQIRDAARKAGMIQLFEDGIRQVVLGVTSLQEVSRALNPGAAQAQQRTAGRRA